MTREHITKLGQQSLLADAQVLQPIITDRFAETSLRSALYLPNAYGGGRRRWAWDACSGIIDTCFAGAQLMTETNIDNTDYGITTYGAPCVSLDGATEYYTIADSAWQEPGAGNFFVSCWARFDTFAAEMGIISKFDTGSDLRSWMLNYDGTAFAWYVNSTGLVGANISVTSSVAEAVDTWYYIAGFYQPSTLIRIFVGAASDTSLTVNSNTTSVPASLFNGAAPFAIGCRYDTGAATFPLDGYVSQASAWGNVAAANVNNFADRIFQLSRRFFL